MKVDRSIYEREDYWRDCSEGTGRGEWLPYIPIQLFIRKVLGHGKLLDVGCGCGPFIQHGDPGDIYGIDFSHFAVTHPLRGAEGKMTYGEITDIPYKNKFFHIVTAFNMLEHIDPKTVDVCLDELFRVSSKYVILMTCLSDDYKPALEYEYLGQDLSEFSERQQHEIKRGHWCLHTREWWEQKIGRRGKVRPDLEKQIIAFTSSFLPEEDQAWTFKTRSFMVIEKAKTIEEIVDAAITENPPSQSKREVFELCEYLAVLKPATILEIGVFRGGTMNIWSKFVAPDALMIGVDTDEQARLNFAGNCFILGDSTDAGIVEQIGKKLQGRPVDFLFIDGLHTEPACLSDLMNYTPMVRSGGIIALHDAVGNAEVKRAIAKFIDSTGWPSTIFFRDKPEEGVMGIQMFVKP